MVGGASTKDLRASRQTIQFMTLVWNSGENFCFPLKSVQEFLNAALAALKERGEESSEWLLLADAIVNLLTVSQRLKDEPIFLALVHDECFVWSLFEGANRGDLLLACRRHSSSSQGPVTDAM